MKNTHKRLTGSTHIKIKMKSGVCEGKNVMFVRAAN